MNSQRLHLLNNVILITIDSLSASDMSIYGYHRNTTPFISDFSKTCYVFNSMYANSNSTYPGIYSILTGKYPTKNNLNNLISFFINLFKGKNIIDLLKREGYQILIIAALDKVFISAKNKVFSINPTTNLYISLSSKKNITYTELFLNNIFKKAFELLEKAKSPFFFWLHIYPPHAPYLPSERFRGRFLLENSFNDAISQKPYINKFYSKEMQPEIYKLRCRYNEQILDVDFSIGKLFNLLKQEGFMQNTIIIITSDHGEIFEKGFMGHGGRHLYNPLIRIPLLIHLPGNRERKMIRTNAQQVDILPTILDILGFDIPKWIDGKSLKHSMDNTSQINEPVFSIGRFFHKVRWQSEVNPIAVVHDGYKLIYQPGQIYDELYNITDDPAETQNLSRDEVERTKLLKHLIKTAILKYNN
jgi:arylsulfatase A-like enzyme